MTKTDFDAELSSINRKITKNKTKYVLNKLKTFDSGYFIGKIHFEEDGVQNYLVFQPLTNMLKLLLMLIQNIFRHSNLKYYQTKVLSLLTQK